MEIQKKDYSAIEEEEEVFAEGEVNENYEDESEDDEDEIWGQGSHKLWKTWKIPKKNSMHGKIMEFCEIIWQNHQ